MKRTILLVLFAQVSLLSYTQSFDALASKADSLYQIKNYEGSWQLYKKAIAGGTSKNASYYYNAACSAALSGHDKDSFTWLNLAVTKGWTNIQHVKKDTDLNSLHDNNEWIVFINRFQLKMDSLEATYNKPLQKELLRILEEDQKYRNLYVKLLEKNGRQHPRVDSLAKIIMHMDSMNLVKVESILHQYGWVGKSVVGKDASQSLFLVVQHSELPVQKKYLPLMREAVKKGEADPSALALLEDRVALREGRKQIYGSQIKMDQATGKYYIDTLENPDKVDEYRAAVGLGPLADYVKRWGIKWDVEEYKKSLTNK